MRTKLTVNDDVTTLTNVPCVGNVPVKHSVKERNQAVVVARNKNDLMAEAFRTLRTNLQFVMKMSTGKVVMFTSTTSGEGKTFVASNLAMSVALLGKKVLLMGLDIRRPRLAEVFNFSSSIKGLTSYLAAQEDEVKMLDNLIIPSKLVDGFDLLPAGIIPPNPAELLSGSNLDRAIEYLRDKYDYIIFDAAPVGLVSDSMIASRVADIVAYVVRIGYTHKADAKFIESLIKEKKFENVAVVVNGDDLNRKSYGAQGSNRYSTYGYSYLDDSKRK
jgi:capsular exopolysaccharide synthesis family protein